MKYTNEQRIGGRCIFKGSGIKVGAGSELSIHCSKLENTQQFMRWHWIKKKKTHSESRLMEMKNNY